LTLYTVTDKGETGVVILVDDVTKQMKAENKVAERDKVSAMGELASAMAYDVNLPLQTISSSLQQAEQKIRAQSPDEANQALATTLKNAQLSSSQASAIIQNLLDLANSHQQEKQKASVTNIMDRSIALAGQLFSDFQGLSFDKINISRHYQEGLPEVMCFTAELEQVFVRLLRNAFHALNRSGQENPYIKVEVSDFYDSLWVKVHHNGRVLSELEQEDIFQSYFSLNSRPAACPVEQRLSYSYFIITNHHQGQMSVTSNEKFGTTFNIQLPLA
jgi:signal transduction histidine kinase